MITGAAGRKETVACAGFDSRSVFDEYPTEDLKELFDAVYTEYPAWARNSLY